MNISISNRLQPFSHTPGVTTVIPGTDLQAQIFPCLIRFSQLGDKIVLLKELSLEFCGPLKDFTVLNDLEKGEIRVWGESAKGFIRYRLFVQPSGILRFEFDKTGEGVDILKIEKAHSKSVERLSFGNHKAQDIDLIRRRLDLSEIWPLWFQLGQMVPEHTKEGEIPLLDTCQQETKPENLNQLWLNLFQGHFHGLLAPRLFDDQYQGFDTPLENRSSPLVLLSQGVHIIRRSFIQETSEGIHILPLVPPQLHSGRLVNAKIGCGTVDFEWTKKAIRRLIVHATEDHQITFRFKHCKQFRFRRKHTDKGEQVLNGTPLFLEKNCRYFFDNFK